MQRRAMRRGAQLQRFARLRTTQQYSGMRLIVGLLALLFAASADAQQVNPAENFRTVETEHFRIHYTPQLGVVVEAAAQYAENAYGLLSRELAQAPQGPIDLVLSDNTDLTNGFAMPFPSNRVVIFAQPPVDQIDIQYFRDWLELVITHELAHTFHIDSSGKLGRAVRTLFGRVPLGWPVFPSVTAPRWVKEGLAVEFESRATGSGRIHGSYNEMLLRTAVLENAFDPIDRFNGETVLWPGGQRAYSTGALFHDYLARTYGSEVQRDIVRKTAGSLLPPEFSLNRIAKGATGRTFSDSYRAWYDTLTLQYERLRDSIAAGAFGAVGERITTAGRWVQFPRISRDGRYLAFAEEDGRNTTRVRIIATDTRETVRTIRRNGIGPASWLADGSLLTSQYEFAGPYDIYSDLYRFANDGSTERLSTEARLQSPDVNAEGNRIVAVEKGELESRLVFLDANGAMLRAVTAAEPGTIWIAPRWSPDGQRIAAGRWQPGGLYDVVVLDTAGQVLVEGPIDQAIDGWPAWSPDGRYVLYHSDRTGIANLYALDTQSPGAPLQITNVLTGAYQPEVSPDGRWVYYAAYHADGFYIERIPYDPAGWRPQPVTRVASSARPREEGALTKAQLQLSESRDYSPWSTLRPYYWLPYFFTEKGVGDFLGVSTSGRDVIGRHSYGLNLGVDLQSKRVEGSFAYTWSGLGNPLLNLAAARTWDGFPVINQAGELLDAAEREDQVELTMSLVRRRWRSSASLTVGGEAVRRRREVLNGAARFIDPTDALYGPVLRVGFARYRSPQYAISLEDGVLANVSGRWRFDASPGELDRGYREVATWAAAYKALGTIGFAHHVAAARFSALLRDGDAVSLADVGGIPGGGAGFVTLGTDHGGLLPVRGFQSGDRAGSQAWTASAEWRVPIILVGRGHGLWPVFLDKVSASVFGDAGNASCTTAEQLRSQFCAQHSTTVLSSAGAELGLDVALGFGLPVQARVGYAVPLSGPRTKPTFYLTFGQAF